MDDGGQIGRVAGPVAGEHGQDPLPQGRFQSGPHRGVVGPGGHRVHLDVVGGVLSGQEPAEGYQAALGGRVGRARQGRPAEAGVDRGDVHDLAAPGPAHSGHDLAGTQVGAGEVHVDDPPPGVRVFGFDPARSGHARVVDQHGRVAAGSADGGEGVGHRLFVGHVAGQRLAIAGHAGGRVEAHDNVAVGGEALPQRRSDGPGRPGHHHHPAHGRWPQPLRPAAVNITARRGLGGRRGR